MATKGGESCADIEAGPRRPSADGESDGSVCFSDADDQSWHSPSRNSPCEGFRRSGASSNEIDGAQEPCRHSCISDCSSEVDLECGTAEIVKADSDRNDKDCRICHLSLEIRDSGVPIVLGCSCKNDLAAAHKQCAETWFKIRGNKTCEICGSIAKNVVNAELIEHSNETNSITIAYVHPVETRSFWQGHRFLNFLLACMIFAFVLSWLFHFNASG